MNKGEEYTVVIEKMLYGGKGLAKVDDIPVFVENCAPNDKVKIEIKKINKNFMEGEIKEIEVPSKYRVEPLCSLSKVCGSCDWLFIEYEEQLKQKKLIIEEAFKKYAGIDLNIEEIIPSPKTTEYRCKIQVPYSQTKVSKRLLSGYYKKNSHELINIKYCHMQPKIINEINEYLKEISQDIGIIAYDENTGKGLIRHVIYRISSDLKQILLIFVINSNSINEKLRKLSLNLKEKYPEIVGICANFNTKKTNVIIGEKTQVISGQNFYLEELNGKKYRVTSTSFFQVNPYCAEKIFNRVKELISMRVKEPTILDAYSGVSSFGIWLSDIAKEITSIEEVKSASMDAIENIKLNNCKNLNIINGDAEKEFEKMVKKAVQYDVSVTDPPRKGCSKNSIEYLSKLTKKYIIYVSCNPSTLARDVKLLKDYGFELEYIQGIDMFPNTYHVESIAVLKKI